MRDLTRDSCCLDGASSAPSKCKIFVAKSIVAKNQELGASLPAIVVKHKNNTYFAVEVRVNGTVTFHQRDLSQTNSPTGETPTGPLVWCEADWPVEMVHAFDASKT